MGEQMNPAGNEIPRGSDSAPERETTQEDHARQAARLQRVMDYQASALAEDDLLQSVLGSANSGLMWIAVQIDEQIQQALASEPARLEQFHKLQPAFDACLRINRQIDRYAQVALRARAPRRQENGPAPADRASPDASPPAGSGDRAS